MRNLFFLLLIIGPFNRVHSQKAKVNIALQQAMDNCKNKDELFPLFVVGSSGEIKKETIRLKGEVVRSTRNVVQVKLPVRSIEEFSKKTFVKSIPYSFSSGKVLSDTMLIRNNVVPVHNGVSPLLESYTGKGVVFGIIDSGHDIIHPDFRDSLGNTRIYRIWDQVSGRYWDSTSINNGSCTHFDYHGNDHGTHVSGIGAGNGLAIGMFKGVAPEATIVAVASDFSAPNWLSTVVDAVDYIFSVADSLGLPCVINASVGDYYGSHDGTDPAALLIDSIINYKAGRVFVCAAGNAGSFNWHVGEEVTSDTSFTWLKYNPISALGFGSVFYEIWSDTSDFNNVNYAFGANLPSGTFEERGRTSFMNIQSRLGLHFDTIKHNSNVLGVVSTYAEIQDDKYLLQVLLDEPDSNSYYFSFLNTGNGRFDFWSTPVFGTSEIVETGLPTPAQYPNIVNYTRPDSSKTTVSSFTCSPTVITVANYMNRKTYIDVDTIFRTLSSSIPGEKGPSSSIGPDRRGNLKPDIAATGDFTFGPNSVAVINANLNGGAASRALVALGGMHKYNGGTSMASPVVAGVAALYLQKCPNASMPEVKTALTITAKQDSYTGSTPNPIFGKGKVDAFSALNISNYKVNLGTDVNVCGNPDSVMITSPPYISYEWSTTETTQSIYIDTTSSVYLSVINGSGCKSIPDTLDVTWRPFPAKPNLMHIGNDTLICSSDLDIQWYHNSVLITGEVDTLHKALNLGDYYAQVTDDFNCSINSDTVTITILGLEDRENKLGKIYPNPTKGILFIELNDEDVEQIVLTNSLGELIWEKNIINDLDKVELNIQNLSEGIYYVQLWTNDDYSLKKVILLR